MPLTCLFLVMCVSLAIWECAAPKRTFSDMENRPLTQFAAPSVSALVSGRWTAQINSAVEDQFPLRDAWMTLQAAYDAALLRNERNGILLGKDGWLFETADNLDLRVARDTMNAINALAEITGREIPMAIVPMSSAVYSDMLPASYAADDLGAAVEGLFGSAPRVRALYISEALREASAEGGVFFRTDHHWTSLGAIAGYNAMRDALGLDVHEAETRTIIEPEPSGFRGSYYARAPMPWIAPDEFEAEFPAGVTLIIDGEAADGLMRATESPSSRDAYNRLLYGNHGLMELRGAGAEGVLVVIRDSYANMLLPWFTLNYSRVVAIDPRYFAGDMLTLLEEYNEADILCVYGLTTLLTDRNLLRHAALWN
ncbi:MAG: hypothetical protein LBD16_08680 [Oscillospiraceae bacterium]|nr:hypothetical protein [Oscillospiraceae bacterium]